MITDYNFGLSEWSFGDRARCWKETLAICINSLQANTRMKPIAYWMGSMEHPIVKKLQEFNIRVVKSDERYVSICHAAAGTRQIEIDKVTAMKFEMIERYPKSEILVGDVDILFIKDISDLKLKGTLMAGPAHDPNHTKLNAGFLYLNTDVFKQKDILAAAEKDRFASCFEQTMLNTMYENEWVPFGELEHRPWWPKHPSIPNIVHFHGPKVTQMTDVMLKPPVKHSSNAEIFFKNKENCLIYYNEALKYRNYPLPLYDEFNKLKI